MPGYAQTTQSTPTSNTSATSTGAETDMQDQVGNQAIQDLLQGQGTESEAQNLDEIWGNAANLGSQMPDLNDGVFYTVTADDLVKGEFGAWGVIARNHGMDQEQLVAFNQHIQSVDYGMNIEHAMPAEQTLSAGTQIYLPSTDELLFAECRHRAGDMATAVELWGDLAAGSQLEIMRTARDRASGKVGLGYGTKGADGKFYSQNPELAGASEKRTEVLGDEKEFRVNWGASFWKCSVYMHDVVYSAGFTPQMTENDHYALAGHLQWAENYKEVSVQSAKPGHLWQRFGGTRSDESHNAVLSSFVDVESIDDEFDRWTFKIIGAETERAAESTREHVMKKGTNENTSGKKIRFFEPKNTR